MTQSSGLADYNFVLKLFTNTHLRIEQDGLWQKGMSLNAM